MTKKIKVNNVQKVKVQDANHVPRRKDVAALAKVSPSTVSLVLNNTPGPRIPDSTRQRIIDAADELGYQPSAVARALVTGKTMTIGIVFHYVGNPFQNIAAGWMNGVWSVLHQRGYRLTMGEGREDSLLSGLYRERGVDGIILLVPPYDANDDEAKRLRKSNFPVVSIGSKCKDPVGDYVDTDNFTVALQQTERLINAGHRRIVILGGPEQNSAARDRLAGYKAALEKAHIEVDQSLILNGGFNPELSLQVMRDLLKKRIQFTAIFSTSSGGVIPIHAALQEYGKAIPTDVSIVSIDLPNFEVPFSETLDIYDQDFFAIGKKAAEILLQRIDGTIDDEYADYYIEGSERHGNTIRKI